MYTKIRNTIIAATLTTALISAPQASEQDYCAEVEKLARTVMTARQEGVSMRRMIEAVDGKSGIKTMVMNAYEEPRFNGEKFQQRRIDGFADQYYMACIRED